MDLYVKAFSSSLRMCSRPPQRCYSLLPSHANQKSGPHSIVLSLPVIIDSRPYHCDARIYWLCTGAVRHCYYLNTALPGAESGDALLTRSFNRCVLRPGETATSVMENSHRCLCGKLYGQQSALSYHQHTCKSAKTRLSSALGQVKEFLQSAKKRRLVAAEFLAPQGSLSDLSDPVPSFPATSSQVIINQSTATP